MTRLSRADAASIPAAGLRSLLRSSVGEGFFSSNPTLAIGELNETPLNMTATVMLELYDHQHSRWVLLEKEDSAIHRQWQFPNARVLPGELPMDVASRAVAERVVVRADGLPVSLAALEYRVLSVGLEWLTQLSVEIGEQTVACKNLFVFSYHARVQVPSIERLEIVESSSARGDKCGLSARILDLEALIERGSVCPTSEYLWKAYWRNAPPSHHI